MYYRRKNMRFRFRTLPALAALASVLTFPVPSVAHAQQNDAASRRAEHDRAAREQSAHDKKHHTGAKVIGGSAAGGAVIGGLAGGGKGAIIGGAAGAGGGVIANKVRKDKAVKKRERREREKSAR